MTNPENKLNRIKSLEKINRFLRPFIFKQRKKSEKKNDVKPMKIKLPKHLKDKPKSQILEYLANKVAYHYAMAEVYKQARQTVESNGEYFYEDDPEFEKK